MLQLSNDRLHVEIAIPATVYHGSRFDWSAFITQVTLDGKHTFCVPESLEKGEGSGGRGLCNEFGIFRPIGYKGAQVGESFPKIGVGLLRRLDDLAYSFANTYPVEPFPLTVQEATDAMTFQFEPLPCRGYEVRLMKTVRLVDNSLRIEYELENVGNKTITTHEYNHNFLAINEAAPSPDYVLTLAPGLQLEHRPPVLAQENETVHWNSGVEQPIFCRTRDLENYQPQGPVWSLWNQGLGVGISESIDQPILRFAFWNASHVMSPEVFVDIEIAAGETMNWVRDYRFFVESDL